MNTYTISTQSLPAVGANANGNFLVVWEGAGDGDWSGIFGRRYDGVGEPVGGEFRVNAVTADLQESPAVAVDGTGNFVIVWSTLSLDGSSHGIRGQRYDAAGVPLGGEFACSTYTTGVQDHPTVAADAEGNFIVVWEGGDQDGSYTGIFGRPYAADGKPTGDEFQVNTYTTDDQFGPAVATGNPGPFAVVWQSAGQDGDGLGIFGRRYDNAGIPVGTEFQVNTQTLGVQYRPDVAADGPGNFVVVWQHPGQDAYEIIGQRYDTNGDPLGREFKVNSYPASSYGFPAVGRSDSGPFVVTWQSPHDGSGRGIFGQRFDAGGAFVGGEFQVNTYTTEFQETPAVAVDGLDHIVVTWSSFHDGSSWGVFGQRYGMLVFADGFESGDTTAWDQTVP